MIHRNICPICGSENPEGSEFCQVCKANLQTLPSEMFPADPALVEPEQITNVEPEQLNEKEPDLDSPVPVWLASKLKPSEKKPMDFDTFSDMLFGVQDNRKTASPAKSPKPQKTNKADTIYQPMIQNMIEPPLLEPDENSPKTITEDVPGIADFLIQRPARKWEDRKPQKTAHKSSSISLLTDFSHQRPAKKWDDHSPFNENEASNKNASQTAHQLSIWWEQDPPLVESEDPENTIKGSEPDDPQLENSASPTKVADAEEIFGENHTGNETSGSSSESEEFHPENGSLISDLLNEINSNSGSLTPSEQNENRDGTVFYSGNHPSDEPAAESAPDISEITINEEENAASAEMLDRILRNIGYEVSNSDKPEDEHLEETQPQETDDKDSDDKKPDSQIEPQEDKKASIANKAAGILKPIHGFFVPHVIDNPLIPDDGESEEKDTDPYGLAEETIPEKVDSGEEMEIPWDLFGSADMSLPQSPEDPAYRTFSRSGIPEDPGSTTYQQRMISSILGKIIQAENYVQPQKEKNNREISLLARLFLTLLAICGTVVILTTNLTDSIDISDIFSEENSQLFYDKMQAVNGDQLVVVDYTPAYSSLLNNAAEKLISDLEEKADKVRIAAVNPAAMSSVSHLITKAGNKTEFAGWWPAGVISVRSQLAFNNIPAQTWLITSESTSVRYWAEQLAISNGEHHLYVIGPSQLQPLIETYQQADLISGSFTNDMNIMNYGEQKQNLATTNAAVLYLAALVPLAWLFGVIGKAMSSEPKYGRKSSVKQEEIPQNTEKEPEND